MQGGIVTMYRSIGINAQREAIDIMRYKKIPALNHSTKISTTGSSMQSTTQPQSNKTSQSQGKPYCNMMININGHTYNLDKKKITNLGIGAAALIGGIAIKRMFSRH
jgi:hypothetical protein